MNHASLESPNIADAVNWLIDIAKGLSGLVELNVAKNVLRMARSHAEIQCAPGSTLFDALIATQRIGAREESRFLLSLTTKVPLIQDLGPEILDRFRACESMALDPRDGEPLVLCVVSDAIAVGFPSNPTWDRDQFDIEFDELLDDGSIVQSSDWIDNLARLTHVPAIHERSRERVLGKLRQERVGSEVWESRTSAFPHLSFGPEVESCLRSLNPSQLMTVINRLSTLDAAAAEWAVSRGATPRWRSKVSNESTSVLNDPKLREARRFRSNDGSRKLFAWHARFGAGGRIHFRMDAVSFSIEIGYIGQHLPH